jgi:solute:Na+ symporter, SSS family
MALFDIVIVALYMVGTAAWGFLSSRKGKAGVDFSGNAKPRSAWVVFLSLAASFLGGGFSFGLASRAFSGGIGHVITLWGFSAGTVLVGLTVAPRLQRFRGCGSVGGLMGRAYGNGARAAVGMLAALFCCAVVGAQLRALGLLFNAWLGLDMRLGAAAGALVIVALCAAGGSGAAVTAAPLQCLLLLCGYILMLFFSADRAGGMANLISSLPPDRFQPFSDISPLMLAGTFLMFMTGETLAPPYVQRLLAGRDGSASRRAGVAAGFFSVLLFALCGAAGLAAYAFFPKIDPELALPVLLSRLLPPGARGLAASGVLAGLTAAGAAFLGAAVSNLTGDVLPPFLPKGRKGTGAVVQRVATVLFGAAALAVAVLSTGVLDALALSYKIWAPAVAAPLVFAAYGRRAGPNAFWAASLSGILGMLYWELALHNPLYIPSSVFGIMVSGAACYIYPAPVALPIDGKARI